MHVLYRAPGRASPMTTAQACCSLSIREEPPGAWAEIVHGDDVVVFDVSEHLLAEPLAGQIYERPHILTLCRRLAGKQDAGPAVETENIEVAVFIAAVWVIEPGERAGLVGLHRYGGFREQRLGIVGGSGLLSAGSTAEAERSNQRYRR